jgi:hypothetical protein
VRSEEDDDGLRLTDLRSGAKIGEFESCTTSDRSRQEGPSGCPQRGFLSFGTSLYFSCTTAASKWAHCCEDHFRGGLQSLRRCSSPELELARRST